MTTLPSIGADALDFYRDMAREGLPISNDLAAQLTTLAATVAIAAPRLAN